MKAKKEVYNFVAGKYITGDVFNMFEEKIAKKIKSSFSRIKSKGGYNKKHDIHYFIGRSFVDYIDKDICLDTDTALAIIPETSAKEGKLKNCIRCRGSAFQTEFGISLMHNPITKQHRFVESVFS